MSSDRDSAPPSGRGIRPASAGWPLLLVLAVGVIVVAGAWFALSGSFAGDEATGGNRYVEAVVGAPSRVNPLFAHLNDADRDLTTLVFSGLTRLGPDGTVLPDLAETWEVSEDGRVVTFHLRRGVVWHNDSPFTAADVVFTYSLLADPGLEGDPDQAPLWRRVTCSAPDDFTVSCELPEAFAPFAAYATTGILPRHLLEGTDAATIATSAFNTQPIGTGPYRLVEMDGRRALLAASPKYYLGSAALTEIELLFYPDVPTAAAAIVNGEAQGILLDSTATGDDFDTVASIDGLKSYDANRTAYTVLYLNNSQAPFNDLLVRRAIAETVDTEYIIDSILDGRAVTANSPIVSGTWAHNPELEGHERDPDRARDLLETAGWALAGDADVRTRNGVELRLTLLTDQDPLRALISEAVGEQLAEVGFGVTLAREESTDLIRNFLIPRQYQAALFGWDPGPDPDPYPAWHSSQASDSGRNLAAYVNDDADKLMEDARRARDMAERQNLYYDFQDIFQQDIPSVLLYHPRNTYFVTEQIQGIELGTLFSSSSRFRNINEWLFEKSSDIRDQ
jgi:peptide/nickel transport system substrate-binding protein